MNVRICVLALMCRLPRHVSRDRVGGVPAGEATAVVNNPVCVPRILAGSTSNDPIYQKRTSFIANVIAELLHISAFRNYATLSNGSKKICRLGRLRRQHMNFIQCTQSQQNKECKPKCKVYHAVYRMHLPNGPKVYPNYFLAGLAPTSSTLSPVRLSILMAFSKIWNASRTRGQALLELLSLLSVVENKGVKVLGASDLELGDVGGSLGSLRLGGGSGGVGRLDGSLLDSGDWVIKVSQK